MKSRIAWLISLAMVACTPIPQPQPPRPSRTALEAKPIPWKTGSLSLVPATVQHLQVVVTPGYVKGQQFAWLVANGTDVAVVFSGSSADVAELSAELAHRYFVAEPVIGDRRSYVILGSYHGPLPPPPDPPGFPGLYVEEVLALAFHANLAQTKLDEAAVGAAAKSQR